ncbi:CD3072 family TudS-related putative desulfidase [Marinilabilia sp.]|uniref:CD3072 family TudS-related putative desulfidase n=1 Tax=Marinilabilia sp. TaxID=2021252 RepID=UPI0025BB0D69|nr:CD3072 family TudS-related putative desulfidase [Marinilabilia sp.]
MFEDRRSKKIIFLAHCIFNQNAVSDGTASHEGTMTELVELINLSGIGVVQMPCPELHCIGLTRGDINGRKRSVTEENSRIRNIMEKETSLVKIKHLIQPVICKIMEYHENGFEIKGIVGINRSPSCGVETTSHDSKEVEGQGVFVTELQNELEKRGLHIPFVGIKGFEPENARATIRSLIGFDRKPDHNSA